MVAHLGAFTTRDLVKMLFQAKRAQKLKSRTKWLLSDLCCLSKRLFRIGL
jgi:hypothetical protein